MHICNIRETLMTPAAHLAASELPYSAALP